MSFLTEWQQSPALCFGGDGTEEQFDLGKIKVSVSWVGYVLSSDSDQLFVVTRVEMGQPGREPLEFRRVYDPAER